MSLLNKQILIACALCLGALISNAQSMINVEHAAEISSINMGDAPLKNDAISVRRCDQCTLESVRFNQATRFYQQKTAISTTQAMTLDGSGATVLFDPESKQITRVIFWSDAS